MEISKEDNITYEEFILLCKSFLNYINSSIDNLLKTDPATNGIVYKFQGLKFEDRGAGYRKKVNLMFFDVDKNISKSLEYTLYYDRPRIERGYMSDHFSRNIDDFVNKYIYMNGEFNGLPFCTRFSRDGAPFLVKLKPITNLDNTLHNKYAIIIIINEQSNKVDKLYYRYDTNQLYRSVGEKKILLLPDIIKEQIFNNLPQYNFYTLPKELVKYIKQNNGRIDLTENKEENARKAGSFMEIISGKANCIGSSIDTRESIKQILNKLKDTCCNPEMIPKIVVIDSLFFSSIDSDVKTIDPFFHDKDIIKYCDLSKIDFNDADIRGFCLANSNAKINIHKVHNNDISDTDLENVNLLGQDLAGVIADGANLIGTYITVSIADASIINTKFDSDCMFFLGNKQIDIEVAKAMGLDIVEAESKNNRVTELKL